MKMKVIGICGSSASGKTTLAKLVYEFLEAFGAAIFPLDNYYKDFSSGRYDLDKVNFDSPEAFDFSLFQWHLKELKSGNPVSMPVYDYVKHGRKDETRIIYPERFLVVEGLFLFNQEFSHHINLKIYIDTDTEICLERRILRDTLERGRSRDSVINQWYQQVEPMFLTHVLPNKELADIVLPGNNDWLPDVVSNIAGKIIQL